MGYMRHHAIVVTSWKTELLEQAHAKAVELGMSVSDVTSEGVNGYRSFLIAPDGSKEGWDKSERGDEQRAALIEWLDDQRYEDRSTALDWVVVQFGDGDQETLVIRDSDHPVLPDSAMSLMISAVRATAGRLMRWRGMGGWWRTCGRGGCRGFCGRDDE